MKSIVEEASSVIKAIEKGWTQAGKPQEFSIKVFEVEQRNFLGLTTKSAKVAIFYNEKVQEKSFTSRSESNDKRLKREPRQHTKKETPYTASVRAPEQPRTNQAIKKEEKREFQPREFWSEEMLGFSKEWLKETLIQMKIQTTFTTDVKNYYLKISFDNPLLGDSEREKLLFRSFAHLIMQSLRNKFKKGFRGYKVILTSHR